MNLRSRHHCNPLSITTEMKFDGFSNSNPIFVDIGSNKGEFIEQMSYKFNNYNFISCEVRKSVYTELEKKFKSFDNIHTLYGNASINLKNIIYPSISNGIKIKMIFINFPDPWFKNRHKKRRIINQEFLDDVYTWVDEETIFCFQTDQEELYYETKELILQSKLNHIYEYSHSIYGISTWWEQDKVMNNFTIYRMLFSKSRIDDSIKKEIIG